MKNYPESENGWIFDLLIVILVGVGCLFAMIAADRYLRRAERAAFLEGRYDLDHATAWHFAGEEGR